MLEAVLSRLNNWFDRDNLGRFYHVESGALSIKDGALLGVDAWLKEGQYYRILGSVFNDGLHKQGDDLADEDFNGCAYALAVPKEVIALSERISEWQKENASAVQNPYTSESFGGYSYTLKSGNNGAALTWKDAFENELRRWRKL